MITHKWWQSDSVKHLNHSNILLLALTSTYVFLQWISGKTHQKISIPKTTGPDNSWGTIKHNLKNFPFILNVYLLVPSRVVHSTLTGHRHAWTWHQNLGTYTVSVSSELSLAFKYTTVPDIISRCFLYRLLPLALRLFFSSRFKRSTERWSSALQQKD